MLFNECQCHKNLMNNSKTQLFCLVFFPWCCYSLLLCLWRILSFFIIIKVSICFVQETKILCKMICMPITTSKPLP